MNLEQAVILGIIVAVFLFFYWRLAKREGAAYERGRAAGRKEESERIWKWTIEVERALGEDHAIRAGDLWAELEAYDE